MFTSCKAPARSLPNASKKALLRYDNIDSIHDRNSRAPFSTSISLPSPTSSISPPRYVRKASSSAKERQRAQRDQLTRLLKESPGKRDARNFLKHFDTPKAQKKNNSAAPPNVRQPANKIAHNDWQMTRTGVNLGTLYEPTVFTRDELPGEKYGANLNPEPLHLALVKLRQPQSLDDKTIGGIALTLSQMAQLGLSIAVVVDCDEHADSNTLEIAPRWEKMVREQAARLVTALEAHNEPGAFEVEHVLGYSKVDTNIPSTVQVQGGVHVKDNHLLFPPIDEGIIPVIPPVAYDGEMKKVRVQADDVLLALTREFAGISSQSEHSQQGSNEDIRAGNIATSDIPALDRIIILDPLGGIPSQNRSDGAHAFINLEAEYKDIQQELQQLSSYTAPKPKVDSFTSPAYSNPFSKFVETEFAFFPDPPSPKLPENAAPARHSKNLDVVQRALKLLPPSSSGLILTPLQAATQAAPGSSDVQTEPLKNPLIHNLLTDRPMISSSLPTNPISRPVLKTAPNPVTFLKKGIPLTMIPDPLASGGWQPPSPSNPSIELSDDPRINFPKLVALIEDSFRRKLDPKHYLDRVRGRVAGVIIAGDYEGGAICTWETPSLLSTSNTSPNPNLNSSLEPTSFSSPFHTSQAPPSDSPYWIPYLDKFAVLTSSQGSGGVSDIVWAALTRTCFPNGLIWRSRTSNPVNKWYQERARGMWNLPGGQWTMFWTTEGVIQGWDQSKWGGSTAIGVQGKGSEDLVKQMKRWDAYVNVCSGIAPSWGDGKKQVD